MFLSLLLVRLLWASTHEVTFIWDSIDPVYVRGDFTSPAWALFDELQLNKPENKLTLYLQPGTYEFRFYSPQNDLWHEVKREMKILEGAVDKYELVDNGQGGINVQINIPAVDSPYLLQRLFNHQTFSVLEFLNVEEHEKLKYVDDRLRGALNIV